MSAEALVVKRITEATSADATGPNFPIANVDLVATLPESKRKNAWPKAPGSRVVPG